VIPLVACNMVGVVSCVCCILTFIRLCKQNEDRNRARRLLGYACTFVAVALISCSTDLLHVWTNDLDASDMTLNVLGTIGCTATIGMFSSPIAEFSRSIQTRSTKTLSLPLALASFVCGFLWTCLGLELNDVYIWFPNAVGVLVSTCQLLLFARFRNGTGGGYNLVLPLAVPGAPNKKTFELSGGGVFR